MRERKFYVIGQFEAKISVGNAKNKSKFQVYFGQAWLLHIRKCYCKGTGYPSHWANDNPVDTSCNEVQSDLRISLKLNTLKCLWEWEF